MSNFLRSLLEQRGMTVYRLAKLTSLPTNTLYRIHNNPSVYPDKHVVDAICRALECQPGDLLKYAPDVEVSP